MNNREGLYKENGWVYVRYSDGMEMDIPATEYTKNGGKPPYDNLPTKAEYDRLKQKPS